MVPTATADILRYMTSDVFVNIVNLMYVQLGAHSQDKSNIQLNDLSPLLTHSSVQGGGGGGGCNNMSLQHMYMFSTAVDCGTLTNPPNGQVSHTSGTTYGRRATYSCNTGYYLAGSSTRTCQATGVWSGSMPICQGMWLLKLGLCTKQNYTLLEPSS